MWQVSSSHFVEWVNFVRLETACLSERFFYFLGIKVCFGNVLWSHRHEETSSLFGVLNAVSEDRFHGFGRIIELLISSLSIVVKI